MGASSTAAAAVPSSGDGLLDHLRQISAPTTAQAIADHFKGQLARNEAERRCSDLVAKGLVATRESAKIKLFWASQRDVVALSDREAQELDREIAEAKSQLLAHQAEVARQQHALKSIQNQRSPEEVREAITSARLAVEAARDELAALHKQAGGSGPMSEKEEEQVKKEYTRMRKLYLDRRRTCLEVLGHMGDAEGKSTKALMESLGLEQDVEYGCDPKDFPPLADPPRARPMVGVRR